MKKVFDFIKTYLLAFAEGPILKEGGEFIEKALENFRAKNPEAADGLVVGFYMLVTTVGEDMVKRTDNEYDDHALEQVKKELVEYATRHGITLPEINKP